ncbi:hypothetical protein CGCSCA5_v001366 [Colletotrichum siamense]|nr:hypothetical protein CGCSCA5_v001366 [Colletotrichum siamense]
MAIMNVALITTSLFVLLGVLICAVSETGDIKQPWRLYEADCGTTAKVNVLLHLLVNVFSTIVLASSNFFMQVLNAPTRKEVDSAHSQGKWLNIGISSFRNAFCLSRFKMLAWFSLLLTSVPLHVVFNSSIFQMDSRMGDFRVTIATEEFLHGGSYFLPGASLIAQEVLPDPWGTNHNADRDNESFLRFPEYRDFGNRNLIPSFRDLADNNFSTETTVVSDIADQASGWRRLATPACRQMYTNMSCSGLRGYRNLVMVAQGSGWIRSDIWNLSATTDGFLASIVPRSVPNHLWFSTQCQMQGSVGWDKYPLCLSDCTKLLPDVQASEQRAPQEPWSLNPRDWYAPKPSHWWNGSLPSSLEDFSDSDNRFKLDSLNISHCLVEPRNTTCTVAISKPLLLAVVSSILLKAVTCAIALRCLGSEQPLVTPGDAISSFISKPSREISVLGFLTQTTIRQRKQEVDTERTPIYQPLLPKQWAQKKHRQTAAVPFDVWFTTYAVLSSGIIGMLIWFLHQVTGSTPL